MTRDIRFTVTLSPHQSLWLTPRVRWKLLIGSFCLIGVPDRTDQWFVCVSYGNTAWERRNSITWWKENLLPLPHFSLDVFRGVWLTNLGSLSECKTATGYTPKILQSPLITAYHSVGAHWTASNFWIMESPFLILRTPSNLWAYPVYMYCKFTWYHVVDPPFSEIYNHIILCPEWRQVQSCELRFRRSIRDAVKKLSLKHGTHWTRVWPGDAPNSHKLPVPWGRVSSFSPLTSHMLDVN